VKKKGVKFGQDLIGSRVMRWALVNILMNFKVTKGAEFLDQLRLLE
jgi:hypothetical protein